jgi:methionine-rich copper-binding protein CopC
VRTNQSRRGFARHHRRGDPSILARQAAVLGGLLLTLSIAAPALAHAELVSSTPEDRAVLETPPTTITLTFSEGLDAGKSSFKLVGGGATIGTGKADADGATVMTLDGLALAPGAYEIQWTSAATDGHIDRGALTFTVSQPAPATAGPVPAPVSPSAPATGATPSPSGEGGIPAASSTDVLIPIVIALVAVAGVGAYVLRRSRGA